MGRVNEEMVERIQQAARMAGKDEWEVLEDWNRNLRRPEAVSIEEYIARMAKNKEHLRGDAPGFSTR